MIDLLRDDPPHVVVITPIASSAPDNQPPVQAGAMLTLTPPAPPTQQPDPDRSVSSELDRPARSDRDRSTQREVHDSNLGALHAAPSPDKPHEPVLDTPSSPSATDGSSFSQAPSPPPAHDRGETKPGEVRIEHAPDDLPTGTYAETTTVIAFATRAEPERKLRAPSIPSMKPFMAKRCIVLRVSVDATGRATPELVSNDGLAPFFVERAMQIVRVPWKPATSQTGEPVADIRSVHFCW